jgi:integrase/recombinase XerD
MLFYWLIVGQIVPSNPHHPSAGPNILRNAARHPCSRPRRWDLLDSIETRTLLGLRDRALVGLMGYTFAPGGRSGRHAGRGLLRAGRWDWIRLHEKGGKVNEMPAHHRLEEFLDAGRSSSRMSTT